VPITIELSRYGQFPGIGEWLFRLGTTPHARPVGDACVIAKPLTGFSQQLTGTVLSSDPLS